MSLRWIPVAYSTAYPNIVAVLYAAAMLNTYYDQLIIFIIVFFIFLQQSFLQVLFDKRLNELLLL